MIMEIEGVLTVAAKVQDYAKEIKMRKKEALENKQTEIVIRAGDLHRQINKGTPTLVTCCMAMKKLMLEEDSFVENPENKSGASANLTIRYLVHDVEQRKPMFTNKQRGRKKGCKLEKKEEKKSSIQESLEHWLQELQLPYEIKHQLVVVNGAFGAWNIRIASARGRRSFILDEVVFSLLKYADESTNKYSVCMNASKENRKDWERISPVLKQKMNITALFIKDNEIIEE